MLFTRSMFASQRLSGSVLGSETHMWHSVAKKEDVEKNSSRLLLFSSNLSLAATNRAHRPHRPVALMRPAASAETMLGGLSLRGAWLPSWSDKNKKRSKPDLDLSHKFALFVARLLLWSMYSRVSFLESSSNQLQVRAAEKSCCSPARITHTHTHKQMQPVRAAPQIQWAQPVDALAFHQTCLRSTTRASTEL